MTIDEVSERYQIPAEILREYEGWGLCGADSVSWQCGKQDLERLSLIMTLHDIGFCKDEVEEYMRLLLEGENTEEQRMQMLNKRRGIALDEIHLREKQLDRVDYLRYKIQNKKAGGKDD